VLQGTVWTASNAFTLYSPQSTSPPGGTSLARTAKPGVKYPSERSSVTSRSTPRGPYTSRGTSRPFMDMLCTIPGKPRKWSP